MDEVIVVKNLTKRFGGFMRWMIFHLRRGEGFGSKWQRKTTVRMLCKLLRESIGFDITVGEDKSKYWIHESEVFFLYEDLKVWENIKLFAGIYGMKKKEIAFKTDILLKELGFVSEKDTFVKALPLGWKQKLAFSVAIFHQPKVVFLDEPTGRC